MDEGTLNDLLECSVCLERLDTSSKVLPCQHTFCKKCLEEIVQKHKELRCPECRVLVNIKVDELPPNVLLMRILEGMRNSGTRKTRSNRGSSHQNPSNFGLNSTPVHYNQGSLDPRTNNKHPSAHLVAHQPYAKAMYDYCSKETGDLSFKRGDVIILKKRIDSHWYQGECGGKQGVFPLSYVQIITPLPSHIPQCKALYDFHMPNDEEEGCLTFNKGNIIHVIRRVDENWAEGKLDGRIGIFPLAFVELNNLARSLMKLSTNSQPGPSRLAPPTPTTEDSAPLIPTDHTNTVVSQQIPQIPVAKITKPQASPVTTDSSSAASSGSSSTTTPMVSSSNTSSSPSTAPSSPASPPPRAQPLPPRTNMQKSDAVNSNICSTPQKVQQTAQGDSAMESPRSSNNHKKDKRHSFTGSSPSQSSASTHRHSVEISPTGGHLPRCSDKSRKNAVADIPLPAAYIALYPYKPQKSDELELRKGGIYMVTEVCQDGWYKGTSNRTQKCGVFPGNYVTLARGTPNPSSSKESTNESKLPVSFTKSGKSMPSSRLACNPPELPPRAASPSASTISSSWHGQQGNAAVPLGRSCSAIMPSSNSQLTNAAKPLTDKCKDRREKGTVSLMKRLASIKRSKSPPLSSYSMDNPVFEDVTTNTSSPAHPVHVRSGSCPSQLLQIQPGDQPRMFGSTSQRLKHKERPSILTHHSRTGDNSSASATSDVHHHRKSNSLDAGKIKTGVQTVRERFRCIAPYPPNSEYELELQVNDIIYVHKKRDDGWYKGTQQRTGKTGLFPASFVEHF